MWTEVLVAVLLAVLGYCLVRLQRARRFFADTNIKHLRPNLLFGNTLNSVLGRCHLWEDLHAVYSSQSEETELLGFYTLLQPVYVPRDRRLVQRILVQDFSYFHDRTVSVEAHEITKPFDANLFVLTGSLWKAVRNKFIPIFTTGKLKYMYGTMSECGQSMAKFFDEKNGKEVEITDAMYTFAMEITGSTIFGLVPSGKFLENGKRLFDNSLPTFLKTTLRTAFPKFSKLVGIAGFSNEDVNEYFCRLAENTLDERLRSASTERNDLIQLLVQLKQKGKIELPQVHDKTDEYLISNSLTDTREIPLTKPILVGGAFTFLLAGFHSSAMTLAYALYELSRDQRVVGRIREEMQEVIQGALPTFEELKKLVYLEWVVKETLRLHPTTPFIVRVCTKDYTTPGGHHIQKGGTVFIPVQSLHMDADYWPEPHLFRPERFETDPLPGSYLGFGDGPRICIGMRFAMTEMKLALAKLLTRYNFKLSSKTSQPLRMLPRSFLATPESIYFHVAKIS